MPPLQAVGQLLFCAVLFSLAACGGGGNGGGVGENVNVAEQSATPPTITSPPVNASVEAPSTATFSVVASGSEPQTFQWLKNGTPIAGATAASYTTPATVEADSGAVFTVSVTNGAGSVVSTAATLSVTSSAVAATPSDSFARCATAFPADKTLQITTETTGSTIKYVLQFKSNGAKEFDGHVTTEYEIVTQDESGTGPVIVQQLYIDVDRITGQETRYGVVTTATSENQVTSSTILQRPPHVSPSLIPGQTVMILDAGMVIPNNNGGTPIDFSGYDVVTYLGMETITVPAGTFLTCKFRTRFANESSDQDDWILIDYGWPIKTLTSDETWVASKVLLDGVSLP